MSTKTVILTGAVEEERRFEAARELVFGNKIYEKRPFNGKYIRMKKIIIPSEYLPEGMPENWKFITVALNIEHNIVDFSRIVTAHRGLGDAATHARSYPEKSGYKRIIAIRMDEQPYGPGAKIYNCAMRAKIK